jgi:hypothetical protein
VIIYIYLTAIGLTPGGSSTVHIYTQTVTQNTENGTYITIKRKHLGSVGPCPAFASCTMEFTLQLRKNMDKSPIPRWQQYSTHLHTNSTQNTQNGTYITIKKMEVRAVPRLCELYPGICLTTEEKARKTLG